jgi:5-methylcytosine-specific restriction protein A
VFEKDRVYRRRDLHELHGGQRQGGISTPAGQPFILLFTGSSGEQYGYRDGWEADGTTFRYSGEGQEGSMQFAGGNAAIRDHAATGKDLYLFEADGRGKARYLGQMVCAEYEVVPNVPDRSQKPRDAIVFRLVSIEGAEILPEGNQQAPAEEVPRGWYWDAPLEQVLSAALKPPVKGAEPREAKRNVQHRSEAVKVYVQRRAAGKCEGCGQPAPFKTAQGRPYLEPHHTRRLSDGGPDHPAWVVAVCPTCHRRAHHAVDAKDYNRKLTEAANALMQPSSP